MCRVACTVEDGLVPTEKIARIRTVDGASEEVTVSEKLLDADHFLKAGRIGVEGHRVLIELPRETASGRWRLWVAESDIREP